MADIGEFLVVYGQNLIRSKTLYCVHLLKLRYTIIGLRHQAQSGFMPAAADWMAQGMTLD